LRTSTRLVASPASHTERRRPVLSTVFIGRQLLR
jgi:hypothetical protein